MNWLRLGKWRSGPISQEGAKRHITRLSRTCQSDNDVLGRGQGKLPSNRAASMCTSQTASFFTDLRVFHVSRQITVGFEVGYISVMRRGGRCRSGRGDENSLFAFVSFDANLNGCFHLASALSNSGPETPDMYPCTI